MYLNVCTDTHCMPHFTERLTHTRTSSALLSALNMQHNLTAFFFSYNRQNVYIESSVYALCRIAFNKWVLLLFEQIFFLFLLIMLRLTMNKHYNQFL